MTTYAAWVEHVASDVPGIGPEFLLDATRDAIIEFCERTLVYRYDVPAISVVALTSAYTVTVPAGTVMWDVITAKHNGLALESKSKRDLDVLVKDWTLSTTTGVPEYFYLTPDRTQIRLVKTPSESLASGLVLEIVLKPSRASTSCPDWFLEHHKNTIKEGVHWKLFAMQKKPWTNPQLAQYHMQQFLSACSVDGAIAENGNTRAPLRCTPVR